MISTAINQVGQAIFGSEVATSVPGASRAMEIGNQEGESNGAEGVKQSSSSGRSALEI